MAGILSIQKLEDTIGSDFTTMVPFDETQNGCSVIGLTEEQIVEMISDDCPDIDGDNSLTDTYSFTEKIQVDSSVIGQEVRYRYPHRFQIHAQNYLESQNRDHM